MPPHVLRVLYTAQLAGHLDLLPRLFTLIQAARAEGDPALLVDLGGSCAADVAECAATEGRATLFVLDAMGYDLACLSAADCAPLSRPAAAKLLERVSMAVCGMPHAGLPVAAQRSVASWTVACLAADAPEAAPAAAAVILRPAVEGDTARLEGRTVWLPPVAGDRLGVARLEMQQAGGAWRPVSVTTRAEPVTPATRADATVAAAVAFVREEVRLYRHSSG